MNKQSFKITDCDLLKGIKGCTLEKILYNEPIFGSVKLLLDNYSIIINNDLHEENFLGEDEEITYFTLRKESKDFDYRYFENDDIKEIDVSEKIMSVSIVTDLIRYNNEYEVSYDVAIILKSNKHEYIISRDWFYMETMEISIDRDINDILDVNNIIEQYRGESNVRVTVTRSKYII